VALRKYQGVSSYDILIDSSSEVKKEDRKTEKNSQSTTAFDQLEKGVEQLEFYFRMILLFLIAIFVIFVVSVI